jgi:hypothetical protein
MSAAAKGAAPAAPAPRVEQEFHEVIWNAANAFRKTELAVDAARSICERLLSKAERLGIPADDDLIYSATRWIEEYGESYAAKRAREEAGR